MQCLTSGNTHLSDPALDCITFDFLQELYCIQKQLELRNPNAYLLRKRIIKGCNESFEMLLKTH